MDSTKPYLVRAIHEWCSDRGFTPYLVVVVDRNTRVPRAQVKDGRIVLNISYAATQRLVMDNEAVSFYARFSGRAMPVYVPMERIAAIYARENGQGMAFEVEMSAAEEAGAMELSAIDGSAEDETVQVPDDDEAAANKSERRPKLTRVK